MVFACVAAALVLAVGGLTIDRWAPVGRVLGTVGAGITLTLALPGLWESPGIALALAVAFLHCLVALWGFAPPLFRVHRRRGGPGLGHVRSACLVALLFWIVAAVSGAHVDHEVRIAVAASMLVAMAIGVAWLLGRGHRQVPGARPMILGLVTALALAALAHDDLWSFAGSAAVYTVLTLVFGPRTGSDDPAGAFWRTLLAEHPERLLVTSFLTLIAMGTVVLALPQSATSGTSIGAVDAAFTAVSAVCVTGLIVRDTPVEFTLLGQVTILVLIQLGALGIMTFSTAALRFLGGRMSLRQESAVARLMGNPDRSRLVTSAQDVLAVTLAVEAVGALLLTLAFLTTGDSLGMAAWRGTFTSISAFCNAGFALQSDSLIPYQHAPLVLHTVAVLIVLGGLSPAIVLAVSVRRDPLRPLPVQAKVCLAATAALLGFGFVVYLAAEWNASLAELAIPDKIHNAWFQSATLRTAGFNSVDLALAHPASYLLMLALMFIGGSPGGTAGGIKTTTAVVLLLSVVHTIRGSDRVTVFRRQLPARALPRAAVVVTVGFLGLGVASMALLLTQDIAMPLVLFEAVSALGTVGLSQGATAQLDGVGKLIVMVCMFIGRLGLLSILMIASQRHGPPAAVLATEEIDLG